MNNENDQNNADVAKVSAAGAISGSAKKNMVFALSQDGADAMSKSGYNNEDPSSPLLFAIQQAAGTASSKKAPALAFTENPAPTENYMGLTKTKRRLLPDDVLKLVRVQDHLIAAILRARGSHLSLFGHLRKDRFDIGVEVSLKKEFEKLLSPEQYEKVVQRMKKFEQILLNCGHTEGLEQQDKTTLASWLDIQVRNGLTFGRFATEIIYDREGRADKDGKFPFNRFRAIDVATIERTVRKGEAVGKNMRAEAMKLLANLSGESRPDIDLTKLESDEYAWIQKIDGLPRQAFTHDELIVFNLFESTDIEHNGYPVSPLDTVISSVTTHISIDAYKKLYFQNGRASRGMLVINSDEMDEQTLNGIKINFNASINSVSNSFRTPIFGMGKEDTVQWLSMNGEGAQDRDFQFMYDQVARNILSAFSISPDELPGYSHLSRGTNSQTLCLHPSSRIFTPNGLVSIGDMLNGGKEVNSMIWTGEGWSESKAFWTGPKDQVVTKVDNGVSITTSPDHRFMALGEDGEPTWKHQKELKVGDFVLINKNPVSSREPIPSYNGKLLTLDMVELLGWLTGDGNIHTRLNPSTGNIKQIALSLFYHHEKEIDIWEKQYQTLLSFGLAPIHKKRIVSEEEKIKMRADKGVVNVANERFTNHLYDTDFAKWLYSIGFSSSTEGKTIPAFMFSASEEFKGAFFSADATVGKNGSIRITIHDNNLRDQTKQLLLSMGIRTQGFEGNFKKDFGFGQNERVDTAAQTFLNIKDKKAYFEKIGMLQAHKQPKAEWALRAQRQEKAPKATLNKYVNQILSGDNSSLTRAEVNNLYAVVNESINRSLSLSKLTSYLVRCGIEVPSWMTNYHAEPIVSIEKLDGQVEMVDITVHDENHAFIAEGFVVHNSESNSEFKLTAARDTGLRPLIMKFQTFFNQQLFALIDPLLSQICEIHFEGLDAQSKEQESTRLQQDMPTHMTMDDVLHEVDKEGLGETIGGQIPFNERYQLLVDKYVNVGEFRSRFMGDPAGIVDPILSYKRDPFFLQYMQLLAQANPAAVMAYFAPKPHAMEFLMMNIQDDLDGEENT